MKKNNNIVATMRVFDPIEGKKSLWAKHGLVINGESLGFKIAEVEFYNTLVIRAQKFNHNFVGLSVLDAENNSYKELAVFNGHGTTPEADMYYKKAVSALQYLCTEPKIVHKQARLIHTPHSEKRPVITTDIVSSAYYVDEIVVYGAPIGRHGQYQWRNCRWEGAEKSSDATVRLLAEMKARVFPRYARKAYANRKPGDFVGLGGPDAKFFKDSKAAVRFIREHSTIRLLARTQPMKDLLSAVAP